MSTLYELVGQRLELQHKLEELNFDEETIADTLEGDSLEIQTKIESYAFVIRNMESLPEVIKAEEKRLADRRKQIEKRIEKIKEWLTVNMKQGRINKIESPVFTITLKKNPPKLVIDDAGKIPSNLYIYPVAPPPTPDNAAIKAALLAGEDIQGAHIEQGERVDIK